MAKTKLLFSTGAQTPLFLPLYLLQRHQGFQLQSDYSLDISPPEKSNENGDLWAAEQLSQGASDFAVCDPIIAEEKQGVRVVATIVGRMAFWAVAKQNIRYFEQFESFGTILCYPSGMTGHSLARMIRARAGKRHKIHPVPVNAELVELLNAKGSAVALTANLLLAKRFVEEHQEFKISSLWTLYPAFSSFMLTGLLARQTDVEGQYALVKNVVQGLQRAVALVMTDEDEAIRGLQAADSALSPDEAQYFVRTVRKSSLYPTTLTPDLSGWHNVRDVHILGADPKSASSPVKAKVSSTRTFFDSVATGITADVEQMILSLIVRFGKGDLYEEVARKIDDEGALSLDTRRVVGGYYRFDDDHRDYMDKWARRIKMAVLTPSHSDENFLVAGTSGSGKTYFIEEIGRDLVLAGSAHFENINLSKLDRTAVEARIEEISHRSEPILCLLDEIDTTAELTVNYSFLFEKLRWRKGGKQIVFVLVGSKSGRHVELAREIESRYKGTDLMQFVPADERLSIPDYTLWDRLIIFFGAASESLKKRSLRLAAIEKLALYYVAVTVGGADARGLARLGQSAVNRLSDGADKVRYDHLFDAVTGTKDRFTFYSEHFSVAQKLVDHFVTLKD